MTTGTIALASALAGSLAMSCASPTYNTQPPFTDGDPPSVYVAKIKNILIGQPATDADIAAVTADPTALAGLIDTWMTQEPYTDLYQQKMQVFFELAFQQTQINEVDLNSNVNPPQGLNNAVAAPLMVQNVRESFARTVVAMTMADQPLTNAFTTKQLMMTPALMSLYGFMDELQTDDNGNSADPWVANHNNQATMTLETSKGPIPLADSLNPASPNYLVFYNSELASQVHQPPNQDCSNLDPITVVASSNNMFNILFGIIPNHKCPNKESVPANNGTGAGIYFQPSDFTTWKLVTIRPPMAGETATPFENLDALRTASELVLTIPRPGFFSTPAFGANWPTNTSNQMRVTLNQALIVATGAQIDGTDPTIPPSTPGLDPSHTAPGTSCVGCHQLLDPTRSILSMTYSWYYSNQTPDSGLTNQPGLFAFQGVIAPMASIDDFAKLLATHPLVAQAWAQKLCYYVNSAPCAADDPVFQQIVKDFSVSFSWNTLVKELLSSPIVTNATDTRTHDVNGEVIAVSRRDHLCAALNNRLGFVDICELNEADQTKKPTTIAQIVSGMPSDGYGRGATIPVLPNQPSLFYRSGLENVCTAVAAEVIDATPDPAQPGAKQWSSKDPTTAINDFVSIVLALTPSNPRTVPVTAALTSHFQTAMAAPLNASATDALRSTFVTACLSPSFIGIGM